MTMIAAENDRRHNHYKESNVKRCSCGNFIRQPTENGLNRVQCNWCKSWNTVYTNPNR